MSNVDKVMLSNLLSNIPLQQDDILIKNFVKYKVNPIGINTTTPVIK